MVLYHLMQLGKIIEDTSKNAKFLIVITSIKPFLLRTSLLPYVQPSTEFGFQLLRFLGQFPITHNCELR